MEQPLFIYNTLSRQKELFKPLNPGRVGMYVCGPTVYGDAHLGHARPAITFDILFRYLQHIGYKVRYVRNITDVGHLEHDADEGEDKIAKKARLEQLEPMEVAQYYTNRFHEAMDALGCLPPSIEPHATGHIIEQQALVQQILDNGYAYESNGSIYFDIEKYNKDHRWGILSGRDLENIKDASRDLAGVGEKKNQADFALWKAAQPEHIMRWPSPWSDGFPGWHCECTAMGRKYLGDHFDIHGGGMDLIFPHHECEIAQAVASQGDQMVHYWMHNNMITIDGKKMGKSYNNFITLPQFFDGSHPLLSQAYTPMTIRFFTKGSEAPNSIGAGDNGTCGTVTIGGAVYWNGSTYENGGDTYLTQGTLVYPALVNLAALTSNYIARDGDILTGELDVANYPVKISIAAGATVTLDDATINGENNDSYSWAGITCLGNATIILEGTNSVKGFYNATVIVERCPAPRRPRLLPRTHKELVTWKSFTMTGLNF